MYYFLHCCKGSTLSSYYDKVHIKAPHPKGGTLVFFSKFYTPILALCSLGDVTISTLYSEPIKLDKRRDRNSKFHQ